MKAKMWGKTHINGTHRFYWSTYKRDIGGKIYSRARSAEKIKLQTYSPWTPTLYRLTDTLDQAVIDRQAMTMRGRGGGVFVYRTLLCC